MAARYIFYFNPMSRAQIARWALHEVGAEYDPVLVPYGPDKPAGFLEANPMGKVPTLVDRQGDSEQVVSETAAICHYLALAHPEAGLLPQAGEAAAYFRWLFFAAGPLEHAVTNNALGWHPTEEQQGFVGYGSFDRVISALTGWLAGHDFICGERFTMADVYVGAAVDWGQAFNSMPADPVLAAYAERVRARPAYQAAKAIDNALMAKD